MAASLAGRTPAFHLSVAELVSDRAAGWMFVAVQITLLGTLIMLAGRDDFALSEWLSSTVDVVFWVGILIAVVAGLSLGRSLTATPVPTSSGDLQTGGLYRFVRHPIYTGVILIVVALALRSGSFVALAVGVVTLMFFTIKTSWEERRLENRYAGYAEYAARTPRFIPLLHRRHR